MKLVILESPYAGDVEFNEAYARACMRDCLLRGESPYASHLLYTQPGVLDDEKPHERELGINAGFHWRSAASKTVVYTDLGFSSGMNRGIIHAKELEQEIEYRELPGFDHFDFAYRLAKYQCEKADNPSVRFTTIPLTEEQRKGLRANVCCIGGCKRPDCPNV